MGCRMSKKTSRKGRNTNNKDKQTVVSAARLATETEEMTTFLELGDIQDMKRAQLQRLCKQFGLKASGKNTELITRLQEYQKEVNISNNKNNTEELRLSPKLSSEVDQNVKHCVDNVTFEIADSQITADEDIHVNSTNNFPLPKLPATAEENEKHCLDNVTFEIVDSQIPVDEHVHVSSADHFSSRTGNGRVLSGQTADCNVPDSTIAEAEVHENSNCNDIVPGSRGVLRELNREDTTGAKLQPNGAKNNACTKWCVVEGLLKQENKALWRRIHLMGGKPMISNSFGKRVPFMLEPCGLATPDNCDDNYICGNCVKDNETALRWQGVYSQVANSSTTPQDAVNPESEVGISCSTPASSNHSLLTSLSRIASVKRKRSDDANSSMANTSAGSDQMEKKRRKDNVVRSAGNTPASPQIRRARGEQLVLPRNLWKPWHPKKTTKTSQQAAIKEDTEFARRVEEIIKNTQPGSDEEMFMIMSSKSSKIRRSPTKLTPQ